MPIHYMFILKMATAMFVERLHNFRYSTLLIPESQRCTYVMLMFDTTSHTHTRIDTYTPTYIT
jgi:hypothetical protein